MVKVKSNTNKRHCLRKRQEILKRITSMSSDESSFGLRDSSSQEKVDNDMSAGMQLRNETDMSIEILSQEGSQGTTSMLIDSAEKESEVIEKCKTEIKPAKKMSFSPIVTRNRSARSSMSEIVDKCVDNISLDSSPVPISTVTENNVGNTLARRISTQQQQSDSSHVVMDNSNIYNEASTAMCNISREATDMETKFSPRAELRSSIPDKSSPFGEAAISTITPMSSQQHQFCESVSSSKTEKSGAFQSKLDSTFTTVSKPLAECQNNPQEYNHSSNETIITSGSSESAATAADRHATFTPSSVSKIPTLIKNVAVSVSKKLLEPKNDQSSVSEVTDLSDNSFLKAALKKKPVAKTKKMAPRRGRPRKAQKFPPVNSSQSDSSSAGSFWMTACKSKAESSTVPQKLLQMKDCIIEAETEETVNGEARTISSGVATGELSITGRLEQSATKEDTTKSPRRSLRLSRKSASTSETIAVFSEMPPMDDPEKSQRIGSKIASDTKLRRGTFLLSEEGSALPLNSSVPPEILPLPDLTLSDFSEHSSLSVDFKAKAKSKAKRSKASKARSKKAATPAQTKVENQSIVAHDSNSPSSVEVLQLKTARITVDQTHQNTTFDAVTTEKIVATPQSASKEDSSQQNTTFDAVATPQFVSKEDPTQQNTTFDAVTTDKIVATLQSASKEDPSKQNTTFDAIATGKLVATPRSASKEDPSQQNATFDAVTTLQSASKEYPLRQNTTFDAVTTPQSASKEDSSQQNTTFDATENIGSYSKSEQSPQYVTFEAPTTKNFVTPAISNDHSRISGIIPSKTDGQRANGENFTAETGEESPQPSTPQDDESSSKTSQSISQDSGTFSAVKVLSSDSSNMEISVVNSQTLPVNSSNMELTLVANDIIPPVLSPVREADSEEANDCTDVNGELSISQENVKEKEISISVKERSFPVVEISTMDFSVVKKADNTAPLLRSDEKSSVIAKSACRSETKKMNKMVKSSIPVLKKPRSKRWSLEKKVLIKNARAAHRMESSFEISSPLTSSLTLNNASVGDSNADGSENNQVDVQEQPTSESADTLPKDVSVQIESTASPDQRVEVDDSTVEKTTAVSRGVSMSCQTVDVGRIPNADDSDLPESSFNSSDNNQIYPPPMLPRRTAFHISFRATSRRRMKKSVAPYHRKTMTTEATQTTSFVEKKSFDECYTAASLDTANQCQSTESSVRTTPQIETLTQKQTIFEEAFNYSTDLDYTDMHEAVAVPQTPRGSFFFVKPDSIGMSMFATSDVDFLERRLSSELSEAKTSSFAVDKQLYYMVDPADPTQSMVVMIDDQEVQDNSVGVEEELQDDENQEQSNENREQFGENQMQSNENQEQSDENQMLSNENQVHSDENQMLSNENQVHSDENLMQSNENQVHSDENKEQVDENQVHRDENELQSNENQVHSDKNQVQGDGNRQREESIVDSSLKNLVDYDLTTEKRENLVEVTYTDKENRTPDTKDRLCVSVRDSHMVEYDDYFEIAEKRDSSSSDEGEDADVVEVETEEEMDNSGSWETESEETVPKLALSPLITGITVPQLCKSIKPASVIVEEEESLSVAYSKNEASDVFKTPSPLPPPRTPPVKAASIEWSLTPVAGLWRGHFLLGNKSVVLQPSPRIPEEKEEEEETLAARSASSETGKMATEESMKMNCDIYDPETSHTFTDSPKHFHVVETPCEKANTSVDDIRTDKIIQPSSDAAGVRRTRRVRRLPLAPGERWIYGWKKTWVEQKEAYERVWTLLGYTACTARPPVVPRRKPVDDLTMTDYPWAESTLGDRMLVWNAEKEVEETLQVIFPCQPAPVPTGGGAVLIREPAAVPEEQLSRAREILIAANGQYEPRGLMRNTQWMKVAEGVDLIFYLHKSRELVTGPAWLRVPSGNVFKLKNRKKKVIKVLHQLENAKN